MARRKRASATGRKASSGKGRARKAPAKKKAAAEPEGAAKGTGSVTGVHRLREDHPFAIYYADHEPRKNSDLYKRSRPLLIKIAKTTTQGGDGVGWYYGDPDPDWEDHHGGGLWAYGSKGWFFVKNYAGMEWASQFCADPAKVECLRQNALRLYDGFPETEKQVLAIDPQYPFAKILNNLIKTADDLEQWTDSIFNASVPLPRTRHTGVSPEGHGVHHYPTPVWDIELFKHADFTLWVTDNEGQPAAVVPVHPRGAPPSVPDYGKVAVTYATPGTALHQRLVKAWSRGRRLVADAGHRLAKQAFQNQ
jgi:uncharacterized protein DUF6424